MGHIRLAAISIFFLMITLCHAQDIYTITGNLTGFPDKTKIRLFNLNTEEVINKTTIVQDNFKFKGSLNSPPDLLRLDIFANGKILYAYLFIDNEDVYLQGSILDLPRHLKVNGSKMQDDFNVLNLLTRDFQNKRDSLTEVFLNKKNKKNFNELNKELWGVNGKITLLDDTIRKIKIKYIRENLSTYNALRELHYLKRSLPIDTLKVWYEKVPQELKGSKYGKALEQSIKNTLKYRDLFYDFEAIDENNIKHKLSEIKGTYILLDITSTTCKPCIAATKELKEIYKTYNNKISIVSFSGDASREVWMRGVKRDNVPWLYLWDGKGEFSETIATYKGSGYPTFVLISPEGKVLSKWTGFGEGIIKLKLKDFLIN